MDYRAKLEIRAEKSDRAQAILDKADKEKRDLTDLEAGTVETLLTECEDLTGEIDRHDATSGLRGRVKSLNSELDAPRRRLTDGGTRASWDPAGSRNGGGKEIRDSIYGHDVKTGEPVYDARDYRMVDYAQMLSPDVPVHELDFGRYLRGLITGSVKGLHPVEQRVMLENVNTQGGTLVPSILSNQIIDLARNKSVVLQAGARIVPFDSDTLTIARWASDPTFTVKAEDASFTPVTPTLDSVNLTSKTVGAVVDSSRELAEDAPNFSSKVSELLATSLAVQLDTYALTGVAGTPGGLITFAGVTENAVGGAPDWDDFLDSLAVVRAANHTANAYVMSSNTLGTLEKLKINAEANHHAVPPPSIAALDQFDSESLDNATAFLGDFRQFIWGVRHDARIFITEEAGTRFDRHSIGIKVVWRGDFNIEHGPAFEKLTGIT